jgi:hypothetical protein
MRFGAEGSEEHEHFRGVYMNYIKPTLEEEGFDCLRADEVATPGAILTDILEMLFHADICVADLTMSNPNVFYELAIRQLARPEGTILIRDPKRVPSNLPPFDIAPLRILTYEGSAAKISDLKVVLRKAVGGIRNSNGAKSDNQIHDPFHQFVKKNVLGPVDGSSIYSADTPEIPRLTPWQVILKAEEDAADDRVPKRIIARAHEIAKRRADLHGAADPGITAEFVACVKEFFQITVFEPSTSEFAEMHWLANRLDMRMVASAIIEEGLRKYPKNRRLNGRRLTALAHSDKQEALEAAKTELAAELKLKIGKDATVETIHAGDRVDLLGLLLDVYQRQGEHDQALKFVTDLKKNRPNPTSFILRNYARAIENIGKAPANEITQAYREAIIHPDEDETAAQWFSKYLRSKNRPVDALEAISLSCIRASNYAESFAFLAHDLAKLCHTRTNRRLRIPDRTLPKDMTIVPDDIIKAILMAKSCQSYDVEDQELCELAMSAADVGFQDIEAYIDHNDRQQFSEYEREDFAADIYEKLKSALTS